MQKASPRLPLIDAFKAIASQLIVLHHLSIYGPLSETMHRMAPNVFGWLGNDARIAVQVFLVIGGFLAANSLAPEGALTTYRPFELIKKRYFKLAIPFIAAILVCLVASALARTLLTDEAIPNRPTLWQFMAHAALLHGVLGFDSLSAGAWYIAIDFQLFVLLLVFLWAGRITAPKQAAHSAFLLISISVCLSLFHFNRDADWDNWAIYFFGAYGIGALSFWCAKRNHGLIWLSVIALTVVAALIIDFRSRILIALLTALMLGIGRRSGILEKWPNNDLLAWLGKISYSVFLIHFPLILVSNAIFAHVRPTAPTSILCWMAGTWGISIATGALFFFGIENRAKHWQTVLITPITSLPLRLRSLPRSN